MLEKEIDLERESLEERKRIIKRYQNQQVRIVDIAHSKNSLGELGTIRFCPDTTARILDVEEGYCFEVQTSPNSNTTYHSQRKYADLTKIIVE